MSKKVNCSRRKFVYLLLPFIYIVISILGFIFIINKNTASNFSFYHKVLLLLFLFLVFICLLFWIRILKRSRNMKQRLDFFVITKLIFSGSAYSFFRSF